MKKAPDISGAAILVYVWQEREDSNPRPLVLETSALTRLSYAPAPITIITGSTGNGHIYEMLRSHSVSSDTYPNNGTVDSRLRGNDGGVRE